MPQVGPAEILVILVVALLIFGPQRLPELTKQAGRAFRELKRVQEDFRAELSDAFDSDPSPAETLPVEPSPVEPSPIGEELPPVGSVEPPSDPDPDPDSEAGPHHS